jgi:N-acetylneuraminate synthase/N,N'-diacetyllegionaminate synthase
MSSEPVTLGERRVGAGTPVFVIAEAGVNHDGDADRARRLVDVAADAGADAVKFQTFRADRVASATAPKAGYQLRATPAEESQQAMLRRLELSREAHEALKRRCDERRILFLSTPFDEDSVDFLDALGVPAFKIASGELTNVPLLTRVARAGKPIVLSTGMAFLGEVDEAVRTLRAAGNRALILLHCVSDYPADPADANLRAMATMASAFDVPVGYSDHTTGLETALAAVALGACVIEKHFTLDRSLPGPDHRASLDPAGLRRLVDGIRTVERALGDGRKVPASAEMAHRQGVRRSVAARVALAPGTVLTEALLESLRPGTGIAPADLPRLVGRTVRRPVGRGELLAWDDLA